MGANSNNTIEEFFIAIGMDTAPAKKAAKEIDKIYEGIAKTKGKINKEEEKVNRALAKADKAKLKREVDLAKIEHTRKQQAIKNTLAVDKALQKTYDKQHKREAQLLALDIKRRKEGGLLNYTKAQFQSRERKAAVGRIGNTLSNKSAQTSASVFEKDAINHDKRVQDRKDEFHKKRVKDRIKWEDRQKYLAAKRRNKEINRINLEEGMRKDLKARLKAHKKLNAAKNKVTEKATSDADAARKIQAAKDKKIVDDAINRRKLQQQRAEAVQQNIYRSASFTGISQKNEAKTKKFMTQADKLVVKGDIEGLKNLQAAIRDTNNALNKQKRSTLGLHTAQAGLKDSTRNMIRSYVSLFAVFAGTNSIKKVGMEFESMRASMLAASKTPEEAADKLEYVRKEAYRLGIDVRSATAAFMQLNVASKGVLTQAQTNDLFLASMEASTALGMSMDDTKGTFRAFIQMMSKGNVQAEELRGQLGERLVGAFNLASKAMGLTTAEMNKQLQLGKITAKELLPLMTPAIRNMARANGALETQLKSTRVAEQRLMADLDAAGDTIFKSGFSEGLSKLYTTMSDILQNSSPQLKKIGMLFGKVFEGLAYAIKKLEPFLKFAIDNFEVLFGAAMIAKISSFATLMSAAMKRAFLPIFTAVAAIEELISLTDDKVVGTLEASMGKQMNLMDGTTSGIKKGEDGKWYSDKKERQMPSWVKNMNASKEDKEAYMEYLNKPSNLSIAGIKNAYESIIGTETKNPVANVTVTANVSVPNSDEANRFLQSQVQQAIAPNRR